MIEFNQAANPKSLVVKYTVCWVKNSMVMGIAKSIYQKLHIDCFGLCNSVNLF